MRAVNRNEVFLPASILKRGEAELASVKLHIADANPKKGVFDFQVYKDEEIKKALHKLFHGKCAYCETFYSASAPVDIEHFRPKGAVSEDKNHPGYWWLAMSWDNLLPSCIDCNRKRKQLILTEKRSSLADLWNEGRLARAVQGMQSGKKDSFPVRGTRLRPEEKHYDQEQALLINPCADDPRLYLSFGKVQRGSLPLAISLDAEEPHSRGNISIQVYGLNRLALVQDRTRVLRQLEFLSDVVLELSAVIDKIATLPEHVKTELDRVPYRLKQLRDRTLVEMRSMADPVQPYSAMVAEWLHAFAAKLR
ncbi:conserved hypothetical protein [Mesorhizobium plurifarium]|uniref:HNH nuclease domain-containing protein n=1 Tax=Mesorhizobium plurifarium TaxID=69974 RepID=A0A090FMT3_MESPL|nr:conserved hypothetical protein [Mesorhizobium plurifarium]